MQLYMVPSSTSLHAQSFTRCAKEAFNTVNINGVCRKKNTLFLLIFVFTFYSKLINLWNSVKFEQNNIRRMI